MNEISLENMNRIYTGLKVYLKALMMFDAIPGEEPGPERLVMINSEIKHTQDLMRDINILIDRKRLLNSY